MEASSARAREPKEDEEKEEEKRESVCFGTRDDSVGEGEGLLFSGTEGEERVRLGRGGRVIPSGSRGRCIREERLHCWRFGSKREEE